jgi:hypothetical protein
MGSVISLTKIKKFFAIPVFYRVRAIPFARNMQFVKRQYIIFYKSRCIILHTNSKYVFWFKVSSDLVNLDQDIIFGIAYIPPENTVYSSQDAFREIENN